jgi:chemotaxis methyl-accepting protein methylase
MQHNVLNKLTENYNIVRAMNILNTSYFSTDEFKIVLKNIYQALKENGFFITGSNQDANSLVHGGLYQKTPKGFKKLWQSGDGSPVDEMILKAHIF